MSGRAPSTILVALALLLGEPAGPPAAARADEGAATAEADATDGSERPGSERQESEPAESEAGDSLYDLTARRDVDLRLRPDVGVRRPLLAPVFSPRTPDYGGADRDRGPRYAVTATFTVFAADGERESFKGQEFRDLGEDVAVGVDARWRDDDNRLRLTGRHLLLDDRDLFVEWRRLGVFKSRLFYNRIPHRFAFDARTLYDGIGTGDLSIDDAARATLQGSTSPADAAGRARELLAAASPVDVGLVRDRLGVLFELTALDPVALKVRFDQESREGARPWSASFGLGSFVELPWPVDYETENVRVELEYALPSTLVRGSYYPSGFENQTGTVVFDNPWRTADSSTPFEPWDWGPERGLIDLYPDNEQEQWTLTFRQALPARSNLLATVAWSRMTQDDPLVPFTTSSAIVPGTVGGPPFDASDPANLPAVRADASLESRLVDVRWTARPTDLVSLKAYFRDDQLDNDTAQVFIPGFAMEDTYWRPYPGTGAGYTNLPIEYAKTTYGLDVAFHFAGRTKLTLGYARDDLDREYREVAASTEDRLTVSVDTKPAPWVDLRASYVVSERDAETYDFDQFFANQDVDFIPILPFLRKFDQADRDRDRLQLMATFYPSAAWIVGAQVILGEDEYPASRFGVLADEHQVYAVDASYALSERVSFFGSYSFEKYDVDLAGREWFPGAPSDPFQNETGFESNSNWTAETVDEIDSATLGLELVLVPDRLRFDFSLTYSKSDGAILYASPVGTAADDLNPFELADFDEVDDVTFYSLNPELEYSFSGRLSLSLVYLRERYEILDLNTEGFQLVPTTPEGDFNGGLLLGSLPGDYTIDLLALRLKVEL